MTGIYDGLTPAAERLARALDAAERCSTEYQAYADVNAVAAARNLLEAHGEAGG